MTPLLFLLCILARGYSKEPIITFVKMGPLDWNGNYGSVLDYLKKDIKQTMEVNGTLNGEEMYNYYETLDSKWIFVLRVTLTIDGRNTSHESYCREGDRCLVICTIGTHNGTEAETFVRRGLNSKQRFLFELYISEMLQESVNVNYVTKDDDSDHWNHWPIFKDAYSQALREYEAEKGEFEKKSKLIVQNNFACLVLPPILTISIVFVVFSSLFVCCKKR